MEGTGTFIDQIYLASHFLIICSSVFSKALGLAELVCGPNYY